MTKYWSDSQIPQWSHQTVITVSRSTWMTTKQNGVAIDLFCMGVISHPGCMCLNWGPESLIQNNIIGLRKSFGDSKSGSTITCEEGLVPSRRPFENGTNQAHIIFQFKQVCFYLPIVNHNGMHKLLHISRLFDQQPFFVRNGLKMTPIQRRSILNFIFSWDDGETEDRAKVSTSSLFEGLLINNFKSP